MVTHIEKSYPSAFTFASAAAGLYPSFIMISSIRSANAQFQKGYTMKSFKQFTYNDRLRLEVLVKAKHTPKEIAEILHFHISTIYRELDRGQFEALNSDLTKEMRYSPDTAYFFRSVLDALPFCRPLLCGFPLVFLFPFSLFRQVFHCQIQKILQRKWGIAPT